MELSTWDMTLITTVILFLLLSNQILMLKKKMVVLFLWIDFGLCCIYVTIWMNFLPDILWDKFDELDDLFSKVLMRRNIC